MRDERSVQASISKLRKLAEQRSPSVHRLRKLAKRGQESLSGYRKRNGTVPVYAVVDDGLYGSVRHRPCNGIGGQICGGGRRILRKGLA